jgi:RHS repeat-associated protein
MILTRQAGAMGTISKNGFTGAYLDPVASAYPLGNGYRWYLPGLMCFNAPDTLSPFGAGGINPYLYCDADPVNSSDPTGHMSGSGSILDYIEKVKAVEAAAERAATERWNRSAKPGLYDPRQQSMGDRLPPLLHAHQPAPAAHQASGVAAAQRAAGAAHGAHMPDAIAAHHAADAAAGPAASPYMHWLAGADLPGPSHAAPQPVPPHGVLPAAPVTGKTELERVFNASNPVVGRGRKKKQNAAANIQGFGRELKKLGKKASELEGYDPLILKRLVGLRPWDRHTVAAYARKTASTSMNEETKQEWLEFANHWLT